ncbi:MAG: hypothetical protein ACXQS2_05615 [Methermicoccaceae archaeon]
MPDVPLSLGVHKFTGFKLCAGVRVWSWFGACIISEVIPKKELMSDEF